MPPWAYYGSLLLMLVVSAAASVSDVKAGKIRNRLLLRGIRALGLLWAVLVASTFGLLPWPPGASTGEILLQAAASTGVNFLSGLMLAAVLYLLELWSAGDAKLVMFLAAAQPAWRPVEGPLPWAPITVVVGNALLVAVVFVSLEAMLRGVPLLRSAWQSRREAGGAWLEPQEAGLALRLGLMMAALSASLSPLRELASHWAGRTMPGGAFLALVVLFAAYKPLARLARESGRRGAGLAALLFVASTVWTLSARGREGWSAVGHGLMSCLLVMGFRGLLGVTSRRFDAKPLSPEELSPGMKLSDRFLDRLEGDKRWQEAFVEHVGSLRGVPLDENQIKNLREWQAHNAPEEPFLVRTHLPFAPALLAGVVLTAWAGRLLIFG